MNQKEIYVCVGQDCRSAGSLTLIEKLKQWAGLNKRAVVPCRCLGACEDPVNIHVNGKRIERVTEDNLFDKIQSEQAPKKKTDVSLNSLFDDQFLD